MSPTLTGNGTRPPPADVREGTPPGLGKASAGTGRRGGGGRIVPGRCRGRASTCSLVLLPMAALLSLQALWVAHSWQVRHATGAVFCFVSRQVCVQPRSSAVNTTRHAFPADCRAAAPLLLSAGACYRSISPARGMLCGKPAARRCCCGLMGQTD